MAKKKSRQKISKKQVKKQAKTQVKNSQKKIPSNPLNMGEKLADNLSKRFNWGF